MSGLVLTGEGTNVIISLLKPTPFEIIMLSRLHFLIFLLGLNPFIIRVDGVMDLQAIKYRCLRITSRWVSVSLDVSTSYQERDIREEGLGTPIHL